MAVNQEVIAELIRKVVEELSKGSSFQTQGGAGLVDTVAEAVDRAVEAQKRLITMSLESRDVIIAAMRKVQSQSTSNPCSVSQAASVAALIFR